MPDNQVKIEITAEDKASSVLDKISGKVGGLSGGLSKMAGIAATGVVAGFAAMTAFAGSALSAFVDAEEQMAVANKTLQNTFDNLTRGEVANLKKELGSTTVAFDQITDAMEKSSKAAIKLGFDDEDTSQAFARLFQITKDVTKSQEELALAQDLAAAKGISLSAATDALAMVHSGGARVLKQFGIQMDDNATSAEALAILQEKVGGTAEAMANTTGVKLKSLGIAWGNLKEDVGAALAEALTPFINQLVEWVSSDEAQQLVKDITKAFGDFAKQMGPILKEVLPVFIQLMKFAAEAIAAVAKFLFKDLPDAIANAIIWIQQIIDKITAFIDRVNSAIDALKRFVSSGQYSSSGASLNPFSSSFKLPGLAEGGIITRPTLVAAGESGAEAIIPLDKGGAFGRPVSVVINNPSVRSDADITELARQVGDELVRVLGLNLKY